MFSFLRKHPQISADLKRILEKAEARAKEYAHDYIGVEHVFLCFRDLPETDEAAMVLKQLPIDDVAFWNDLEGQTKIITRRRVPKSLPYTPRLEFVLRSAKAWAAAYKQKDISPLHFLAGVAQDRNSLVAHVFRGYFKKKNPDYTNYHAMAVHLMLKIQFPYAVRFQIEEEPNRLIQPTPDSITPPTDTGNA